MDRVTRIGEVPRPEQLTERTLVVAVDRPENTEKAFGGVRPVSDAAKRVRDIRSRRGVEHPLRVTGVGNDQHLAGLVDLDQVAARRAGDGPKGVVHRGVGQVIDHAGAGEVLVFLESPDGLLGVGVENAGDGGKPVAEGQEPLLDADHGGAGGSETDRRAVHGRFRQREEPVAAGAGNAGDFGDLLGRRKEAFGTSFLLGVTEVVDAAVLGREPVAASGGVAGDADHRCCDVPVSGRAVEVRIPEGEHAAVSADKEVPAAVRRGRHTDDRRIEMLRAHRTVEMRRPEREHATVSRHQPIAAPAGAGDHLRDR